MRLRKTIYRAAVGIPVLGKLVPLIHKSKPYQVSGAIELSRHINLDSKDLLVVGIGRGIELPVFFSKGCNKVDGLDPFPSKDIRKKDFGSSFRLIEASAESMPIEDSTYDAVYSIATLEHIPDPAAAMKEMIRVLKPGGVMYCCSNPLWHSPNGYHPKKHVPALNKPWFHLIFTEEEFLKEHPDLAANSEYVKAIGAIYNSPHYNRLGSQVYYKIIADLLTEHIPLKMEFRLASESLFPEELKSRLDQFDVRDLLTEGFCIIFRKNLSHGQSHT